MKLEYFRIGMEGGSTSSYAGIGTLAAGEWVQLTTDTPDIQTGGARGVFLEGQVPGNVNTSGIDYVNIATKANGINFGDLSLSRRQGAGLGSPTRGVFTGGYLHASPFLRYNVIDYITIASTGNAQDFGDASDDNVVFKADISSSILPNDDDSFDLGSDSQRWKTGYLSNLVKSNKNYSKELAALKEEHDQLDPASDEARALREKMKQVKIRMSFGQTLDSEKIQTDIM